MHCFAHATQSRIRISWLEQHVSARLERAHCRFFRRKIDRQAAHAERISNDHAAEVQIVAQNAANYG